MIKAVIFDISGVVYAGEENKEIIELVGTLRERGLLVAALSNVNSTYTGSNAERKGIFSQTFLGAEIGILKPNAEIYTYVLNKLGVKPEEAVFIDDSIENVQGAEGVGIHGIVFQDAENLKKELHNLNVI